MATLITLLLFFWFAFWLYKKLTKVEPEEPEKKKFSEEYKKETQEDFYKLEKHCRSVTSIDEPMIDTECLLDMIDHKELKFKSGKIVTNDSLDNLLQFRLVTSTCLAEGYNPKKKEDREIAAELLRLEDESDEDNSSIDWTEYPESIKSNSLISRTENIEYGSYVIQYRNSVGGSWIDGPGSNDERTAETMFDSFIQNDPRGNRRCRLVYKVKGKIKSVLSTN